MTPDWQTYLAARGAQFDNEQIVDFGDQSGELSAAREATVLCPLTHLAPFECSGEDAQTFLHNQLTSDVNHLGKDASQYAAWCSPKGRMLASFILSRNDNGYLGLLSADLRTFILKRLQMYVLRSKVKIVDRSSDLQCLGVAGPQAEAALLQAGLPMPTAPMNTASNATTTVIRLAEGRFIIIANSATTPSVWESLAQIAVPAGVPAWLWLDIQAGIPLITEATKEAFVPQMVNYDKIGGVSFHKGCYPGQEVVARTQYLGKVKRHLYRFHAEGVLPAGGSIYPAGSSEAQPCGIIASAAPSPESGYDGLAVILEGTIGNGELVADDRRGARGILGNVTLVEMPD